MKKLMILSIIAMVTTSCGGEDNSHKEQSQTPSTTVSTNQAQKEKVLPLTGKEMESFYYEKVGDCESGAKYFALVNESEPFEVDHYTVQQDNAVLYLHNDKSFELVLTKRYFLKSEFDLNHVPEGQVVSEYTEEGQWDLEEGTLVLLGIGIAKNISWKQDLELKVILNDVLDSEFQKTEFIFDYQQIDQTHFEDDQCNLDEKPLENDLEVELPQESGAYAQR